MTAFNVNHQEMSDTGDQTGGKAQEADGIQQKLGEADGLVPPQAWGLIGELTVHHAYTGLLSTLQDHVSEMIKGVGQLGENISNAADRYRESDETAMDMLKEIAKELEETDD